MEASRIASGDDESLGAVGEALSVTEATSAGAFLPDLFYACPYPLNSTFHQLSEDAHWPKFLATAWPSATAAGADKRRLAVLLGVASHQVADVLWHSLGLSNGLIRVLAAANFDGRYAPAHEAADVGGEFVTAASANLTAEVNAWSYDPAWLAEVLANASDTPTAWHLPTLTEHVDACMLLGFTEAQAVRTSAPAAWPGAVATAPWLQRHQVSYAIGGLADMASWTVRCWEGMARWVNESAGATPPHAICRPLDRSWDKPRRLANRDERRVAWRERLARATADIEAQGGPSFRVRREQVAGSTVTRLVADDRRPAPHARRQLAADRVCPTVVPSTSLVPPPSVRGRSPTFGLFGTAMAVGTFDSSGPSLVVGAPGVGCVFITPLASLLHPPRRTAVTTATTSICPPSGVHEQFGASLTVGDVLGDDGLDELIVGAPLAQADQLYYQGRVSVYAGPDLVPGGTPTTWLEPLEPSSTTLLPPPQGVSYPFTGAGCGSTVRWDATAASLLIGCPFAPPADANTTEVQVGAVFTVSQRTLATGGKLWLDLTKSLQSPNATWFGEALAAPGFVGASGAAAGSGAVYKGRFGPSGGIIATPLLVGTNRSGLGASLAVTQGGLLLAGAPAASCPGTPQAGTVQLVGTPSPAVACGPGAFSLFGSSLALNTTSGEVWVSAPASGYNTGSIHLLNATSLTESHCLSGTPGARGQFGTTVLPLPDGQLLVSEPYWQQMTGRVLLVPASQRQPFE